jgi:tRNA threonylcarbamoyladenosine biosynthesis protein TsaB
MKLLAIESSGPVASCALLEDGIIRVEYSTDSGKKHSTTLLPMIDKALALCGCAPADLDAVAVTAGPGSFTGLRIGSATAKGLAAALGLPVIPVPTLMSLAMNAYGFAGIVSPIMDARRDQVYNGLYRFSRVSREEGKEGCASGGTEDIPAKPEILAEQRAVYVETLIDELNGRGEPVLFLGDGVPVYRSVIEEKCRVPFSFAPAHMARQRAASCAVLAEILLREGVTETAEAHAPFYLRPSQAEQEKERARAAAENGGNGDKDRTKGREGSV